MHETVTVLGVEKASGAVYNPVLEIVPTLAYPPTTASTSQVTFVFEFPDSKQVNCTVPPNPTTAVFGVIFTVMPDVLLELPLPELPQEVQTNAARRHRVKRPRLLNACLELSKLQKTKSASMG
jgi:hypothetical protein